jgi:hypothetical protein
LTPTPVLAFHRVAMGAGEVFLGHPLHLDRNAALALLREIGRDRSTMAELRRLFAEETRRSSIHLLRDEAVLSLLADRIAAGALLVARVPHRERAVPPPGTASAGEASQAAQEASRAAQEAADTSPRLVHPRWSEPRVAVGAEVDAVFTYHNLDPGQAVTVTIFECDAGGGRTPKETLSVNVEGTSGDHALPWSRDPDDAEADLAEDARDEDTGPLEYRFNVEASGVASPEEPSGPLWLTNTVIVDLVDEASSEPWMDEQEVALRDAVGEERRTKSKDGEARFEDVLVGPIRVWVVEPPRFYLLRWAETRVPLGAAVEARFAYQGATPGQKAVFRVRECDPGGGRDEVYAEEIELSGARGEGLASFTRSAEAARIDLAADEAEKDTGPLEYRFVLDAEGMECLGESGPLWLTNTLELTVLDEATSAPYEGNLALTVRFGDAYEERVEVAGGRATVEDALIGPVVFVLDPDTAGATPLHAQNQAVETCAIELVHGPIAVIVDILADPAALSDRDRFVLRSEDGSYRQERSIGDDLIHGDDKLTLRFEGVRKRVLYTLDYVAAGAGPIPIFSGVEGARLRDAAAHGGEGGGGEEGG